MGAEETVQIEYDPSLVVLPQVVSDLKEILSDTGADGRSKLEVRIARPIATGLD